MNIILMLATAVVAWASYLSIQGLVAHWGTNEQRSFVLLTVLLVHYTILGICLLVFQPLSRRRRKDSANKG
jgi:hypothetical protein